jgi:hypothetical protein
VNVLVEIAPGELLDKLTILNIKLKRITDPAKLANVRIEHDVLTAVKAETIASDPELEALVEQLEEINGRIWILEDDIRDLERAKDFGARFVEIARLVYRTNDERAATKKTINERLNSRIVEEKSYAAY